MPARIQKFELKKPFQTIEVPKDYRFFELDIGPSNLIYLWLVAYIPEAGPPTRQGQMPVYLLRDEDQPLSLWDGWGTRWQYLGTVVVGNVVFHGVADVLTHRRNCGDSTITDPLLPLK